MKDNISFESLSGDIQKALTLLKKQAEKAAKGIGRRDGKECPIAMAYGIFANEYWADLPAKNRRLLARAGWTESAYEEFIRWHDNEVARPNSSERVFLTEFLAAA